MRAMSAASTESDCLLCRAEFETPVIRESARWRTFINRNQNLLGKTIIALKRHEDDVSQLTIEEWTELLVEVRWTVERIRQAFAPDHFNYSFLMNMDRHLHLHVIPRYVEDREVAGFTFVDPDYPSAYQLPPTPEQSTSPSLIAAVHAALTESARGD
jgi:diadenosine tetraphosphate (Ap4A) HIT family hydrolase